MRRPAPAPERPLTVEAHMGLVHKLAHRMQHRARHLEYDDLVQAGAIGLMRGLERFDPERGIAPSTFLFYWVRQAINRALQNQDRTVRVPVHVLEQRNGYERLPVELSLDAPLTNGAREPEHRSLHDLVADTDAADPSAGAEAASRASRIEVALSQLPARSQHVLRARFWGERTLEEVGGELGCSRERVRQIEAAALQKLERALSGEHAR